MTALGLIVGICSSQAWASLLPTTVNDVGPVLGALQKASGDNSFPVPRPTLTKAGAESLVRQSAAQILSQAYQLSGMKELTANLARQYVNEGLAQKMSTWVGDAIAQVVAERKGPPLSERLKDPQFRAEMQARIAARLKEEIPKLAKFVVYDKLFQGMLNDADPAAQKMVGHLVEAMTRPLNAQAEAWAGELYGKAMEKIDTYIKTEVQVGGAAITLDATNIRGTIDGVMRLETVTDMISGPLSEAMGESAFGEMQRRISDVLKGKLPPELEQAMYAGPDKIDALLKQGKEYLPSAQLEALKNKILALPVITIPNEVYGGMLAGSAARHFALGLSGCPLACNFYEINRGREVTTVMIWQLKNKQGFNMSLGNLLDAANWALGEAGGLSSLGRFGKSVADARDKFAELEKKWKGLESKVVGKAEQLSAELRAEIDQFKDQLLEYQSYLSTPVNEWIAGANRGFKDGAAQIKDLFGDFNGIPPDWKTLKDKLGIPDDVFGEFGDTSILDHTGAIDLAKKANDAVAEKTADFLVDGLQTLQPGPKIASEEKIPAQNPDDNNGYDPVLLHNGEFVMPVVDLSIPGRGLDFQFRRVYRSRANFMGRLGWNWTHNFEESLQTWDSPDGIGLTWVDPDGRKFFFKARLDQPGSFDAPAGVFAELRTVGRGDQKQFELRERGGIVTRFNRHGLLQEKCDRFGNCLRAERDASGTLAGVTDTVGRHIRFDYDAVGRMAKMTDTIGRIWQYLYDLNGDLVQVVSPATDAIPKGIATGYYYSSGKTDAALTHNLTAIRDPRGSIYLKNIYGTAGFARDQVIAQHYGEVHQVVKSRYVLLRPAWIVRRWPDAPNVAVDRVDLRNRRGVVNRSWHNANGNLLRHEIIDATGRTHAGMRYRYNVDGMRVAETRPSGLTLETVYYSGADRMLQGLPIKRILVPLPPGGGLGRGGISREYDYSYDPKYGDPVFEKLLNGVVQKWTYDNRGARTAHLISHGERKITTRFRSNTHGQIIAMTDPRGTITDYEYDAANLVAIVRDAGGQKITARQSYDGVGNITAVTLPNGGVHRFEVDAQNLIRREVTPMGYEHRYDYDAHGNVTAMHVGEYVYRFDYDILDRLIQRREPISADRTAITRYAHDSGGRLTEVIFPEGNRLHRVYDAWGRLTAVEQGAGARDASVMHYQYNADGLGVGVVDGLGHLTVLERNAFGEVTAIIYPNQARQEIARDASGRVLGVEWKDDTGAVLTSSKMVRDTLGLWDRELHWDSQNNSWRETRRDFDAAGNLTQMVQPNGAVMRFQYDAVGNRVAADYPLGIREEWTYNTLGLPLKYTSPPPEADWRKGGATTHYSYDLQGRLTARTDPNSAVTQFSYNDRDNVLAEILPEGAPVHYVYDGAGRRIEVAWGERVTRYDWDGNGRLRALTDPLGRATRYTYDPLDRLTSEHYPDGGVARYRYDANNHVTQYCRPDGDCTTQRHDVMGNVFQRKAPGVTQIFQYDPLGRLTQAQEGDAVSQFVYSSLSEVVASAQGLHPLQKSYNANGQPIQMTFSNGAAVQWQSDALGRVTQAEGPGGFRVGQTWGVHGPERIAYANGRSDSMAYDVMGNVIKESPSPFRQSAGRLAEGEGRGEGSVQYTYNLLGNLTSKNDTHYHYDPWQQLIQAGAEQWQYNLNGERVLLQLPKLQFDKNGNLLSDGRLHYLYDALDRLITVTGADSKQVARYQYDALNRRVAKTTWAAAGTERHTTYVYDGWEPVEIYEDGKLSRQFIRGDALDEPFGEIAANGPHYFHRDRLGSVLAVSDADSTIVEQTEYDPFGTPSVILNAVKDLTGDSSAGPQNDMASARKYTGQIFDPETGLYYMRNRYYSPRLGQFLTRDPIGYKNVFYEKSSLMQPFNISFHRYLGASPRSSLGNQLSGTLIDDNLFVSQTVNHNTTAVESNLYGYVNNSPLNYTDPMGLYVDVVVQDNRVTFKIPIQYKGDGATPEVIARMNAGIQEYWSGQFGAYYVTTSVVPGSENRVTVKKVKNVDDRDMVISDWKEPEAREKQILREKIYRRLHGANRGVWFAIQSSDEEARWTAAHEAGHLMALPDRYFENNMEPHPGYGKNIMGENGKRPSEADILNIIKFRREDDEYSRLNGVGERGGRW